MELSDEKMNTTDACDDNDVQVHFNVDTKPGWSLYNTVGFDSQWDEIMSDLGLKKTPAEIVSDDLVGKQFKTFEAANLFYRIYSASLGFGVRKGGLRRNVRGEPVNRTWLCCKEGERDAKYLNMPNRIRTARGLTREHCEAKFQVTMNKRRRDWVVKSFVIKHSHPLATQSFVQFLRDKRVVCDGAKTTIRNLRNSGMRTTKIMSYLAQQVGGHNNVRFIVKDLYNLLGKENAVALSDGDAERAIGYLQAKADNDGGFYGKYSYDSSNRLQNLLWADSKSRSDYLNFGEVLSFDTTYKTNQYGKPLLVFVGVNNHYRSTVFAYAILVDESAETYMWALSTFIDCMDGSRPRTVITDGDLAMRAAIVELMPTTVHRLCSWHIEKNVMSNVKECGFLSAMSKFIFRAYTPIEFENRWSEAMKEFGLEDNEYLKAMYERRHNWADTYLRSHFFAGMTTTQRCEKMNAFLKTQVTKHMSLTEFLRGIDMANSWLRHKQGEDDYKQFWTKPVTNVTNMPIIEQEAAEIYTNSMFYKVQKELQREGKYIVTKLDDFDGNIRAELTKYTDESRKRFVMYNGPKDTYKCACDMMTCKGIPCRHIFSTMKAMHAKTFPKSLIRNRWRRNFGTKKFSFDIPSTDLNAKFSSSALRFGHITSKCSELASLASVSDTTFDVARKGIEAVITELQAMVVDGGSCDAEDNEVSNVANPLTNPEYTSTKGGWTGSRKGGKGKKKCSQCHRQGHNKATCHMKTGSCGDKRKWTESMELENDELPNYVTELTNDTLTEGDVSEPTDGTPCESSTCKEQQELMGSIGKGWW